MLPELYKEVTSEELNALFQIAISSKNRLKNCPALGCLPMYRISL